MNKQDKINKLTWKYFLEQKKKEILKGLFILFIIISIGGLGVQAGWGCKTHETEEIKKGFGGEEYNVTECNVPYEPQLPYWILYTGIITTSIWILVGLVYWLSSNWEKAKQKVKQKMCKHKWDKYEYCKKCKIDKRIG